METPAEIMAEEYHHFTHNCGVAHEWAVVYLAEQFEVTERSVRRLLSKAGINSPWAVGPVGA